MTMYDPENPQHLDYLERHRTAMVRFGATAMQICEIRNGLTSCTVPEHLRDGLEAHCVSGRPVGQFLTACLSNDLLGAVSHGDDQSLAGLRGIMQILYNYAPPGSWGSAEKVAAWRARGGLNGRTGS